MSIFQPVLAGIIKMAHEAEEDTLSFLKRIVGGLEKEIESLEGKPEVVQEPAPEPVAETPAAS